MTNALLHTKQPSPLHRVLIASCCKNASNHRFTSRISVRPILSEATSNHVYREIPLHRLPIHETRSSSVDARWRQT